MKTCKIGDYLTDAQIERCFVLYPSTEACERPADHDGECEEGLVLPQPVVTRVGSVYSDEQIARMKAEAYAAGKQEAIEAAAHEIRFMSCSCGERIRALLQTEAQVETKITMRCLACKSEWEKGTRSSTRCQCEAAICSECKRAIIIELSP
jgi:hypothetical protein